jgi:hypothetical protein
MQNDNRNYKILRIMVFSFMALGLVGIGTTTIVDYTLNDDFTWSLLSSSAILFSWLCVWPLLVFKKRSFDITLLITCLLALPFLSILCRLTDGEWYPVAFAMSLCGSGIFWLIRLIFVTKLRIWDKLTIASLILIAGNIAILAILGKILPNSGADDGQLLSVAILIAVAVVLFVTGCIKRRDK